MKLIHLLNLFFSSKFLQNSSFKTFVLVMTLIVWSLLRLPRWVLFAIILTDFNVRFFLSLERISTCDSGKTIHSQLSDAALLKTSLIMVPILSSGESIESRNKKKQIISRVKNLKNEIYQG